MTETDAMADSAFDFMKHSHTMSEDELKQMLQKELDNPPSSFEITEDLHFDYAALLDGMPAENGHSTIAKSEEDQAIVSVESVEALATPRTTESTSTSTLVNTTKVTTATEKHTTTTASAHDFPALIGLKDGSFDPLLYSADFDDFLNASTDHSMPPFTDTALMQTMDTLCQPQDPMVGCEPNFQLPPDWKPQMIPPHPNHTKLVPQQYPQGRRRSHTAPPDVDPGVLPQRRVTRGHNPPHHFIYPNMAHPMFLPPGTGMHRMRRRRVLDSRAYPEDAPQLAMGTPRSHPMSPHHSTNEQFGSQHDSQRGYVIPRPQSLTPELRGQISRSMRDMSPDRGRKAKRQKTSHERLQGAQEQSVSPMLVLSNAQESSEGSACSIEQTISVVEFMLRSHMERFRYHSDDEIEKARTAARGLNAAITSIEAPLATMLSKESPPISIPNTGAAVRELNTQEIHVLLDFYDVPFVSTMFLHDKKLQYLRFLGASGTLKHLVLD